MKWWKQAAELGFGEAMFALGYRLSEDEPVRARYWYEQAANSGDVRAMYHFGLLLYDGGSGLAPEPDGAKYWWKRAAEDGYMSASYRLARVLTESEPAEARRLHKQDAKRGDPESMYAFAILLLDSGERELALSWLRRGADVGNVQSMSELGWRLNDENPEEARKW